MAGDSQQRLERNKRLLTAAAYARVFEKATRSSDKWFTVLCRRNDANVARLGLAISKKHCALASARNRIKRITRESFRLHQDVLAGLDVVVMNGPAAKHAGNRQLFDSLESHWERCRQELDK